MGEMIVVSEGRTTPVTPLLPSSQSLFASLGVLAVFAEEGVKAQNTAAGLCISSSMTSTFQIQGETETEMGTFFQLSWPVAGAALMSHPDVVFETL